MSRKSTIWISRDLRGGDRGRLYFWNKNPEWNHMECTYEGETGEKICDIALGSCDNLPEILLALGIEKDAGSGGMRPGQLVELSVETVLTDGVPLSEKAKALKEKMGKRGAKLPRKEILALLDELSEEEEVLDWD